MRFKVISRRRLSSIYSDGIAHGSVKIGKEWACLVDVDDEHAERLENRLDDDENVVTYRKTVRADCGPVMLNA